MRGSFKVQVQVMYFEQNTSRTNFYLHMYGFTSFKAEPLSATIARMILLQTFDLRPFGKGTLSDSHTSPIATG